MTDYIYYDDISPRNLCVMRFYAVILILAGGTILGVLTAVDAIVVNGGLHMSIDPSHKFFIIGCIAILLDAMIRTWFVIDTIGVLCEGDRLADEIIRITKKGVLMAVLPTAFTLVAYLQGWIYVQLTHQQATSPHIYILGAVFIFVEFSIGALIGVLFMFCKCCAS